jgi:hypothetical protein
MRWQYKISLVLLILGTRTADAQDSLSAPLLAEQLSPVTTLRDGIYASPSLRALQRQYNYAQIGASFRNHNQNLYLQQEGSGQRVLTLHSETYLRQNASTTLWGNATYHNRNLKKVKFNETSDYHLVYPYVTSDSVGGDLKAESYSFQAGLAKAVGQYQLGLQAGYKGEQTYRNRDPRPKNTSSTLDLLLSASRKLNNRYALALDINGTKYNQNNLLAFVNDLGVPMVYQDAGLGMYNELLKGTDNSGKLTLMYNGLGYSATLQLAPVKYQGWFARASFAQFRVEKKKNGIIDELSTSREQKFTGTIGYLKESAKRHFLAQVQGTSLKREGIESKFILQSRDSNNVIRLYKLADELRYTHDYTQVTARTVYGQTTGSITWYGGLEAGYTNSSQQYVLPTRELSYSQWQAGIDLTAIKKIRSTTLSLGLQVQKQQNIDRTGYWPDLSADRANYYMLTSNLSYLLSSRMLYGGSLRVDFPLSDKLGGMVRVDGGHQTGIGRNDFSATMAVRF